MYTSYLNLLEKLPAAATMQLADVDTIFCPEGLPTIQALVDDYLQSQVRKMREAESANQAREQALAQMQSVADMVAALNCDYERMEELRGERKHWSAGYNMSGYLPDTEPYFFETFADAQTYIASELMEAADDYQFSVDYEERAKEIRALAEAFRASDEQEISQQAANGFTYWINKSPFEGLSPEDYAELQGLEKSAGGCANEEEARDRIREDALSVEIRSGWYIPYADDVTADEFRILLCTGGPAVRIIGDLDDTLTPCTARLEYQDWGTPWIELTEAEGANEEALLTYVNQFAFGD